MNSLKICFLVIVSLCIVYQFLICKPSNKDLSNESKLKLWYVFIRLLRGVVKMKCKKVKFKVDGVSCLDCFSSLLETMERVAGIAETSIELDSKIATMHYEPNRISKEQIRSIIETIPQSDFRATLMI